MISKCGPILKICKQYRYDTGAARFIVKGSLFKIAVWNWLLSPEFDGKIFVEGRMIDNVWGIGLDWRDPLAEDCKNWKGMNLLDRVLNEVREDLKLENKQLELF